MEPEPEPEPEHGIDNEIDIFIPPDFYCPITGELLVHPFSDPNGGHSYEKESILRWLDRKEESPITREYLNKEMLIYNISLKRSIDSIRDKLRSDQLKIQSRIYDQELIPFKKDCSNIKLNQYYLDDKLFVNISTPSIETRPPIDLVLCIDVSYSMSEEATLKEGVNEKKDISYGISVLSLTISSAKTILRSLDDNDNISIVTYSSKSCIIVENTPCSAENKLIIEMELDNLKPISNTNMWDGILCSLNILRDNSPKNKNKGIVLLTDGIPNVIPPRGHEYMLKKYFSDNKFKCMISCYGFGYNLDSELLLNISNISNGDGYSFIPDSSILGSVFINGISNLLSTAVISPQLRINLSKDICFKDTGLTSLDIDIGSLKYGKDINLIFEVDITRCTDKSYENIIDFSETILSFDDKQIISNRFELPTREYNLEQNARYEAINIINICIDKKKFNDNSFKKQLTNYIQKLDKYIKRCPSNEYIQNILYDFNGQIKESLNMTSKGGSEDWFTRWGIHYLRSIQEAYKKEICNNFKDKGVSNFTYPLFDILCERISKIFESIPPPKPDIRHSVSHSGVLNSNSRPHKKQEPLQNMSVYNNPSGVCCSGNSRILMHDNTYKNVSDLVKGDRVRTYHSSINGPDNYSELFSDSYIECIIKTKCVNNRETMVEINNLRITPYHPIINFQGYEKHWRYPHTISEPKEVICPYTYSIITSNRMSVIIEGVIFSTLGHNLLGDIIYHSYLGTDMVIKDLQKSSTYNDGIVNITKDMIQRDKDNNQIVGIIV